MVIACKIFTVSTMQNMTYEKDNSLQQTSGS